jgi:hypothetical protein
MLAPTEPEPTDTTSFISESDLPEWLRQLAAVEAAQAEEARRAEDAARIATERQREEDVRLAAEAATRATAAEPDPRVHEADAAAAEAAQNALGPAGHWLARKETGDLSRRSAFAGVVGEPSTARTGAASPATEGATTEPRHDAAPAPLADPARAPSPADARNWIMIGALLLLIAAVLGYLYVSGAFG